VVPLGQAVAKLETIPCLGRTAAVALIAEIGSGRSCLPSAKRLASCAEGCPGSRHSASKRLSGKTTQGKIWIRALLGKVAWSIAHTSDSYLAAHSHCGARRHGQDKAMVAVSHPFLVVAYSMLPDQRPCHDLGPDGQGL
jgi:transposase